MKTHISAYAVCSQRVYNGSSKSADYVVKNAETAYSRHECDGSPEDIHAVDWNNDVPVLYISALQYARRLVRDPFQPI